MYLDYQLFYIYRIQLICGCWVCHPCLAEKLYIYCPNNNHAAGPVEIWSDTHPYKLAICATLGTAPSAPSSGTQGALVHVHELASTAAASTSAIRRPPPTMVRSSSSSARVPIVQGLPADELVVVTSNASACSNDVPIQLGAAASPPSLASMHTGHVASTSSSNVPVQLATNILPPSTLFASPVQAPSSITTPFEFNDAAIRLGNIYDDDESEFDQVPYSPPSPLATAEQRWKLSSAPYGTPHK
jgi:hypothetical protein